MPRLQNPILPGFHPDPSIVRVGEDYYIATSTFEWYPGVCIYHSTDLANWELVIRPLNRANQLDMRGNPDSGGVWAPCLSYSDGQFWLTYTDVKRKDESFKDTHNLLVTAPSINGPWSDPVKLNSSGFDPSLFHDTDGRKWLVNLLWDHRARPDMFGGLRLQEYDHAERSLIGPRKTIWHGTPLGMTEGPHLYKRDDWYYLIAAEGGSGYGHAVSMSRARQIDGPYESHPNHQIFSSRLQPDHPVQRAGHGDWVETPDGRHYIVHLASRPIGALKRSIMGRETAIQEVKWCDGWLWLKEDGDVPFEWVDVPGTRLNSDTDAAIRHEFDSPYLPDEFQWLRTPEPARIFHVGDGRLRLFGRESIGSWFEQSLVARRQQHFNYTAETELNFTPQDERQMAGLICYYQRYNFFYLAVTATSDGVRQLEIICAQNSFPDAKLEFPADPVKLAATGSVRLKVSVREDELQFYYAEADDAFRAIGTILDAGMLSDEMGAYGVNGSFTGAFVGMAAHDLNGDATPADFDYFNYVPQPEPFP